MTRVALAALLLVGACRGGSPTVTQIAAGARHTCFLYADGAVRCSGECKDGQLGPRATDRDRCSTRPVLVDGLPRIVEIASGIDHACARARDGAVFCWGGGAAKARKLPLPAAVALSSYWFATNTCAQLADGTVSCWVADDAEHPQPLAGMRGAVAVGGTFACSLDAGAVRCVGADDSGQLGDGAGAPRFDPVAIHVPPATAIVAGMYSACALTTDGRIFCWGVGPGSARDRYQPTDLRLPHRVDLTVRAKALLLAADQVCAASGDGRLACTPGRSLAPLAGRAPAGLTVGQDHACVWGAVTGCFGRNLDGQLGDGTRTDRAGIAPPARP